LTVKITSTAFGHHERIPAKYTCDGDDINPPLAFEDIPSSTRSLALVMSDPDAPGGTWDHWVIWNIPPTAGAVSEGEPPPGTTGKNSWATRRYSGPCPPAGSEHRYVFTLFAMDADLDLPAGAGSRELSAAAAGHILTRAELLGVYGRARGRRS
jgi:Raf kinase inhibitor-like YbhB/YbcL family protein